MRDKPAEPIPPEAMLGKSDWDDEDLLTVAEASERLAAEISAARQRIRYAGEALAEYDSPVMGAVDTAFLAAEHKRLDELMRAAERIKAAQANAPG